MIRPNDHSLQILVFFSMACFAIAFLCNYYNYYNNFSIPVFQRGHQRSFLFGDYNAFGIQILTSIQNNIGLVRLAETWLKNTVPTDLLREKNTV